MSDGDVIRFYADGYEESDRLTRTGRGQLEYLRTRHLIAQRLPDRRMRIADIGGGPGVYAEWLAGLGHDIELVDPVEDHVRRALARPAGDGSIHAVVGDARSLEIDDQSVDAALLLGPLYHLPEPADRRLALAEVCRILRPGGLVFAAAISRFASLHDGLTNGWLCDREFAAIILADLETGHHRNPTERPGWFTDAYFHHPDELDAELRAAEFEHVSVHGVEGLAGWLPDLEARIDEPGERSALLDMLDRVGIEPSILGVSAHLVACGSRPR